MTKQAINQPVDVTAVLFNKQFDAVPRRIEFNGQTVTFLAESIKNCFLPTQFDAIVELTSGEETYRLQSHDSRWTLLEILKA